MLIHLCIVATCQPLSYMNETAPIVKTYGETITMWCPYHPCTETTGDICNFTKINGGSQLDIYQGKVFSLTVKDVNDTGTYCCVPYCANDTEPCCVNIEGMYIQVTLRR